MQEILRSDLVGQKVLDRIQLDEYSGKVLSTVTGAVYLLGEDDEVLWLTSATGMHARAIRLDNLPANLVPQSQFILANKILGFPGVATVDLSKASTWNPIGLLPSQMLAVPVLLNRIDWLLTEIAKVFEPRGTGMFLSEIHTFWLGKDFGKPSRSSIEPVLLSSSKPVIQICRSCRQQDWKTLITGCSDLIGLGYGLTPSGDDLIGGLIFCLRMVESSFPSTLQLPNSELDQFIASQQFKTNIISYCILKDMFAGCASEAVLSFVQKCFYSQSQDELMNSVSVLTQIGHSTGWDILTGILVGCLCLQRLQENISYEVSKERMIHGH